MSQKRKEKDEAKDGEQNQYERFLKTAKDIGANDDEAFEEAIKKIAKVKPRSGAGEKKDQ